jgi:hypothetical protein
MCRLERWIVRTLRSKIGGIFFERTAISKKPEKLIAQELKSLREEDRLSPESASPPSQKVARITTSARMHCDLITITYLAELFLQQESET